MAELETMGIEVTCGACGGTHLAWRVSRVRTPGVALSRRSILWTCRDCGGSEVRIVGAGEPDPPVPGAALP
jgi:hypothetical protein